MMQFTANNHGHPLNYSFPVSAVQDCSVSGLLNQCMEVSGWRYLIDKEVAAGSLQFGTARVMNGAEWVLAFENALQTNRPQWWDARRRRLRNENLVRIRLPGKRWCWFCLRIRRSDINKRKPFYTPPGRGIMSLCECAKAATGGLWHERRSGLLRDGGIVVGAGI